MGHCFSWSLLCLGLPVGERRTFPGRIAMQEGPRRASDDGLPQLLWEFLSQVGLSGQMGRSERFSERLRHGRFSMAERWEKGEVWVDEVPE